MGLSFSATWDNLRFVYGMFKKRSKKKPINIHWVLSEADIPKGPEFVAFRMSVMKEGGNAL